MPDPTYNLSGGFKPTIKRFADLGGPDFFSTPRWATYALIDNEKFSGEIWECACGDGTMSKVPSRMSQIDQRTALADHVRTRRKRTCGPQGGSPGLTDAVEKVVFHR
jgi:hypothetical protein